MTQGCVSPAGELACPASVTSTASLVTKAPITPSKAEFVYATVKNTTLTMAKNASAKKASSKKKIAANHVRSDASCANRASLARSASVASIWKGRYACVTIPPNISTQTKECVRTATTLFSSVPTVRTPSNVSLVPMQSTPIW